MSTENTQHELRNDSGESMRELDRGESFVATRNGAPVGELSPVCRRQFVPVAVALETFGGAAAIDSGRFRRDIDRVLDQNIDPRS